MKIIAITILICITCNFGQGNLTEEGNQAFFWTGGFAGSTNGIAYGPTFGYTFGGIYDISGSVIKANIKSGYRSVSTNSGSVSGVYRPFEKEKNNPINLELGLGYSQILVVNRYYSGNVAYQNAFRTGTTLYGNIETSNTKIIPSIGGFYSFVLSQIDDVDSRPHVGYIMSSLSLARKINRKHILFVTPQFGFDFENVLFGLSLGYLKLR